MGYEVRKKKECDFTRIGDQSRSTLQRLKYAVG
jgi:hypothetical protein